LGVLDEVDVLVLPPTGSEGTEGVIVVFTVEGEEVVGVGEGVGVPVEEGKE
jgi:hypothetical protein